MVLPVFNEVRLIPVSMQPMTSIGDKSYDLFKFVKWLEDVDDISDPALSPPAGTEEYLEDLRNLNDPLWRHQGYNPAYVYEPPAEAPEYDPTTDTGAGWLQIPLGYMYDEDSGEIIGVSGVNEDNCHRGSGNGNSGPSQLH